MLKSGIFCKMKVGRLDTLEHIVMKMDFFSSGNHLADYLAGVAMHGRTIPPLIKPIIPGVLVDSPASLCNICCIAW